MGIALALSAANAWAARPLVLLRSDVTEAFFRGNGGQYELLLTPWRQFFARQHMSARELRAAELARRQAAAAKGAPVRPDPPPPPKRPRVLASTPASS
jgi:hypothetical protein